MALALASALVFSPSANAAAPTEVEALLGAPCPTEYRNVFQREWSAAEQVEAQNGEFPILQNRFKTDSLVPPVDWEQDPYDSLTWRHWLHTLGWWMDGLFYIHRQGGPNATQALVQARDLTLDWIAANPEGPISERTPAWAPKPLADRAPYMAYLARQAACKGLLSEEQAEVLLDSLLYHVELMTGSHPRSAKGMWFDYGLALTGQYLYFLPEAEDWIDLAIERFPTTIDLRVDKREAVWRTNSVNYQATLTRVIELFHDQVNPDPDLAGAAARLRDSFGWFVFPDATFARYGAWHTNVPLPSWASSAGEGHKGLHLMPRSGFAVVKREKSYLGTSASWFFDVHKHADDLGFELYEEGHRLISDSGHHDFDISRNRWQRFARSARAHSVLTVDGIDDALGGRRRYGSGILAGGHGAGWFAVLGTNPRTKKQNVRHHRLFLYRPGNRLLVVDIVRARRPHLYRRHVQIAPEVEVRRRKGGLALAATGLRGTLRSSGRSKAPMIRVGEETPIAGWIFPDTDQKAPRPTVTYRTRARNANLLFEVRVGGPRGPIPKVLEASAGAVRIALDGRRGPVVSVRRHGRNLRVR